VAFIKSIRFRGRSTPPAAAPAQEKSLYLDSTDGKFKTRDSAGNIEGLATLINGTVPASQLPSYVDDVLEAANFAALPSVGATGKIYVTLDNSKAYRWSGSAYVEIAASPGSTDAVPEGLTNLYHTTARAAAAAPVQSVAGRTGAVVLAKSDVGLGDVDNTSDANKPVSTAQAAADAAVQSHAIQRSNHTGQQAASTISDFASTVRETLLTGLSTATNAAITATDSVLGALGKLQRQFTDNAVATQAALETKEPGQTPATQVEAEAGTETAIRSWSPLRVAQAVTMAPVNFLRAAANIFSANQTFNGTNNVAPNQTAGSGSSLMTRDLVDERQWLYQPGAPRVVNVPLNAGWIFSNTNGGGTNFYPTSMRMVTNPVGGSASSLSAGANNAQGLQLVEAGQGATVGLAHGVVDFSRVILFSTSGYITGTGNSAQIRFDARPANYPVIPSTAIYHGFGLRLDWNSAQTRWDVRLLTRSAGAKSVLDLSNTSPIQVTLDVTTGGHLLQNGDTVEILGAAGNSAANGTWVIGNVTSTTFELVGSTGNGTYTGGASYHRVGGVITTLLEEANFVFDMVLSGGTATLYHNGLMVGSLAGGPATPVAAIPAFAIAQIENTKAGRLMISGLRLGIK
jgi:hypothetical protein